MAGIPTAGQSRIRQWINGVEMVEATDVSIDSPQPVGQKFGAAGLICTYKGQAGGKVSITFAQVADRSQFDAFARTQEAFVYVFEKGSIRYMMTSCEWGDSSLRGNYESGDTTSPATIIGTKPKAIN